MTRGLSPFILVAALAAPAIARGGSDELEFFEKQVRPLLAERCFECHGTGAKPKGGLRLTSREAVVQGGESGSAAVAGKPDESLLVQAVRYTDEPRMPPKAKLDGREIEILTRWVALGLPWPDQNEGQPAAASQAVSTFHITDAQRQFWSFQPIRAGAPPAIKDESWPRSFVDRFVLAALEEKGLRPAPAADQRTLIRRATFDLTGLPPTPAEVQAFVGDPSADAFARVVDRLLASKAYGVRWGRHWLDVVRYTDSFDARGTGGEGDCAEAWRYRDWIVEALNRDLPYNEFIKYQVAGDLLPGPEPGGPNLEGIVATGMLAIGNWGGGDADKEKLLTDIADDQVDVVSRAFLGLTIACARCHDHKFDPISTKNYYGLAGIFFSTHILPNVGPKTNGPPMLRIPLESKADADRRAQYSRRITELEAEIRRAVEGAKTSFARALLPETARYVAAAWDYHERKPGDERLTLADYAAQHGLHAFALRQWECYLGLADDYPLMGQSVRDLLGRAGVFGWKGEPDCPSLVVNTTDEKVSLLTFTLPPRSVSVHPGPRSGVAVAWKSPVAGAVKIMGRLADGDGAGGDGVAWTVDLRRGRVTRTLAAGAYDNGGAQPLAGPALGNVEVQAGDLVELVVLPKNGHTCDTTNVDLTIARADGTATWNLAADLLNDPLRANPHPDRLGNPDVWRFEDTADRTRPSAPAAAGAPLADWQRAIADPAASLASIQAAAEQFARDFRAADSSSPFWINAEADESALPSDTRQSIDVMRNELAALRRSPPPPVQFANGAQEGGVPGSPQAGVHDVRVHVRGSYARLGELVPRHVPKIIAGPSPPAIGAGSGRRELAEWLASPDNVLTPRVIVNRVWQHHFGRGIVPTPSNFGKLGERPTHPALLDALARWFIADGWSLKRLHRELMLSAAYQQSSRAPAETRKQDPGNQLFGRMDRQRLESEALRDSLLAVSGRLDPALGGPSTRDFNTPRRTLYLMTNRSDRSGFGPLFDVADPTAMVDVRPVSTVAPQALYLMNHPFVLDQTRALARRLIGSGKDDGERIDAAYALLYARPPTEPERRLGLSLLTPAEGSPEHVAAWQVYCQILLCANEMIYID